MWMVQDKENNASSQVEEEDVVTTPVSIYARNHSKEKEVLGSVSGTHEARGKKL